MFKRIYSRNIYKEEERFTIDIHQVNKNRFLLVCRETDEMATLYDIDSWAAKNVLELMSDIPFISEYRDEWNGLKRGEEVDYLLSTALDGINDGYLPEYPLEDSYCFM